jgi:hypothetical protein
MNLFLVTSAIDTKYTIIPKIDRFNQTIATAMSIKKYAPNSKIILLEGGKPLPEEMQNELKKWFDGVIDFSREPIFEWSQTPERYILDSNGHTVKSPCEAIMLKHACSVIDEEYDRIFKLSGRYTLTDKFNISDHMQKDKFVFLPKVITDKTVTVPADHKIHKDCTDFSKFRYQTTFYSFDNIKRAAKVFDDVFNLLVNTYTNEDYMDIETATYLSINEENVHEVPVIGVAGSLGGYYAEIDR